jgi:glycosyltransferase involved in cell wall biosynthesis
VRKILAWFKFNRYEKWLLKQFDLNLVVSKKDYDYLRHINHSHSECIEIVPNGVDTQYHHLGCSTPESRTLVYNGALTYEANLDAMQYFLGEIFPLIIDKIPGVRLSITGSTNGVPVDALPNCEHVKFTGYLDDIRPTVASNWACVVPLRIGGGTRLKILEAMALGTPVVSTTKGAEGLALEPGKHLLIGDSPSEFAEQTIHLLQDSVLRNNLVSNGIQIVREKYDWVEIGNSFCDRLEQIQLNLT